MSDEAAWDLLVGDIYLSATDAEARARLPDAVARHVGGVSVALWTADPRTGRPTSDMVSNLPPEAMPLYLDHYHRIDPWMTRSSRMEMGRVMRGSELVADEDLARSEYYNDFGRHLETFHVLGCCTPLGADRGTPLGAVSVLRPRRHETFADDGIARLARIVPHLCRAWQIGRRLGGESASATAPARDEEAFVHGLRAAALLLDGQGYVRSANRAAERLGTMGGFVLRGAPPGRQFLLADPAGNTAVHAAVADAARGGSGAECLLPLGEAGPCHVTVSPLPGAGPGRVLVLLTPQALPPEEALLRRAQGLFGFTRTEAEVALALANGRSPAEIAADRGVRMSTIRTQLLSAQDKVDARDLRGLAIRVTLLRG